MNFKPNWLVDRLMIHRITLGQRKLCGPNALFFGGLIFTVSALGFIFTGSMVFSIGILLIGAIVLMWNLGMTSSTGVFLLLIPVQWLAIAFLQLNGVTQYRAISAVKEVLLVSAVAWFFARVHFKVLLPDLLLSAALLLVLFEQIFHPDLLGMRDDWEWTLAYLLGRVLVLSPQTQAFWGKCAVWMCALLAALGTWEVLILGSTPRLLLLRAAEGDTRLPTPFLATGYSGFRAASTMVSPLAFSALCMVGLILWWTYMKNPMPAAIISAGLALTLTRSAVAASVLGILIIAIRRREMGRATLYGGVFLISIAVAIPTLDLGRYVQSTFTSGADTSTVGHRISVIEGFSTMVEHPLGTGAGTVGPRQLASNNAALNIENSYLTIAVEYSILVGLLYIGFFVACLYELFRKTSLIGYAAFSILVGYSLLLAVGPLHLDIPLACWVWVPVGMGITRPERGVSG